MKDAALNALAADADFEVVLPSTPPPMHWIEALATTLGEAFAELFGAHGTLLRDALAVGDATASVESTALWPDAGTLSVAGVLVTYTGKTSGTLTGLTWPDMPSATYHVGTVVEDASRSYSAVDRARADMVPSSASGVWLDTVARSYGEARPWPMSDATFQRLLTVLIYLDRSTWLSVHRVLEAALADYEIEVVDGVTSSSAPQRYTSAAAPFKTWHLHRYARVGGTVRRIVGVDAGGEWVDLAPGGGPWWVGTSFGTATGVRLDLLPFLQEEDPDVYPGRVVVHTFLPASFTDVPPTYLQPAGAAATPPGVPRGGQLMPGFSTSGAGGQPLYIGGGAAKLVENLLLDVVAHGIRPVVKLGQP